LPHSDGTRSGGRKAGTPNKATRELKAFLERVFARAITEQRRVWRDVEVENEDGTTRTERRRVTVSYEDLLVEQILNGTLDQKLLTTMLAYWAGRPAQSVAHKHSGSVKLEQLITGTLPDTDEDEEL
jgi:hypothetical protein